MAPMSHSKQDINEVREALAAVNQRKALPLSRRIHRMMNPETHDGWVSLGGVKYAVTPTLQADFEGDTPYNVSSQRMSMAQAHHDQNCAAMSKGDNIIDRNSHPVVNRPNPIRQHWERFGDQSDLRPVPDNVDELLDKGSNPELRQHLAGILKLDSEEDKE